MNPSPFLGVLLHALGGFAAGSFYIPYKQVRGWAWEVYWLVGGVFSWILVPWLLALFMTSDLTGGTTDSWGRAIAFFREHLGWTGGGQ